MHSLLHAGATVDRLQKGQPTSADALTSIHGYSDVSQWTVRECSAGTVYLVTNYNLYWIFHLGFVS